MAGFKTHITVSSAMGVVYGTGAYFFYDIPAPTCVLAAGLCGVSGMLPDIDSDSGVPLRESLAFGAAVVPMMLAERLRTLGLPRETIILAGAAVYLLVRFVLAYFLKRYTVHRGMFHSIPAALVFGEIAYLLSASESTIVRLYQAGAVVLGYVSHLALDEFWSLGVRSGKLQVKNSFGTALKLFGGSASANLSVYGKLFLFSLLSLYEPNLMGTLRSSTFDDQFAQAVREYFGVGAEEETHDAAGTNGAPVRHTLFGPAASNDAGGPQSPAGNRYPSPAANVPSPPPASPPAGFSGWSMPGNLGAPQTVPPPALERSYWSADPNGRPAASTETR